MLTVDGTRGGEPGQRYNTPSSSAPLHVDRVASSAQQPHAHCGWYPGGGAGSEVQLPFLSRLHRQAVRREGAERNAALAGEGGFW